jgi:hypothetical protein
MNTNRLDVMQLTELDDKRLKGIAGGFASPPASAEQGSVDLRGPTNRRDLCVSTSWKAENATTFVI